MRELQQAHTEEREPELDLILEALAQGALATGWSCFGWNFMEEKDGKRGGYHLFLEVSHHFKTYFSIVNADRRQMIEMTLAYL